MRIYETDRDQLRMRLTPLTSHNAEQRPRDFSRQPNSRDVLFVLRRYAPSEAEKAVQGTWDVVSATHDGKQLAAAEIANRVLTLGEISFGITQTSEKMPGRGRASTTRMEGKYRLDPAREPSEITLFMQRGGDWEGPLGSQPSKPGAKKPNWIGIYRIDGDRLRIAYPASGPRPAEFTSEPESGVTVLQLKRQQEPGPEAAMHFAPKPRVVNVNRDGSIALDRKAVALDELTARLAAARSQYAGLAVLVRGDPAAPHHRVAEVLNAC